MSCSSTSTTVALLAKAVAAAVGVTAMPDALLHGFILLGCSNQLYRKISMLSSQLSRSLRTIPAGLRERQLRLLLSLEC
jgi:hypothetical protein